MARLESCLYSTYEDDSKYTNQVRRILMNFKAEKNDFWKRFLNQEMPHGFEILGEHRIKIDVFGGFLNLFFK